MKKIVLLLVVSLLLFAVGASHVGAQPSSYTSCFQVQNLDSGSDATIQMNYYEQGNGTPVASPSDTVTAGSSNTYCPLSAVSAGFNGSMVISSNVSISAIANVSGDAGFSSYNASYTGFSGGATTVNLPLLFANNFGYYTWFNVQNTSASEDATVNVSYSDGTSEGPIVIGPGQSYTFDQADETHTEAVLAGTITSDEPIVATVMEVGPSGQPMLFGYNGFTSGSTNPVMPLVQSNNFGFTTGIQVQNTGGTSTEVTLTYSPSDAGSSCTDTKTIAPGDSETFGLQDSCIWTQTFVGSAEVTGNSASQDLVAIVNQQNFSTFKGASYSAFDPASGTSEVVMPLIMDQNFGYFTGFNIANVGSDSTTVDCSFTGSGVTINETLAAGDAFTAVQFNVLPAGYVGAATCTASGGSDNAIVGVVNQSRTTGTQDTFLTYEATNN